MENRGKIGCVSAAPTAEKPPKIRLRKLFSFRKRRFYPYIIIVTYIGYFFNVFSPDFSIFLIFSYAEYPYTKKTPFWGIFEGKKHPFFIQMGWWALDRAMSNVPSSDKTRSGCGHSAVPKFIPCPTIPHRPSFMTHFSFLIFCNTRHYCGNMAQPYLSGHYNIHGLYLLGVPTSAHIPQHLVLGGKLHHKTTKKPEKIRILWDFSLDFCGQVGV